MADLSYNAFQTGSTPPPQGFFSKVGNFLSGAAKDVANTLLVTPAARATEAATRLFAPNSQAAQGYNAMADQGQGQSFGSPLGNIDVPAQKAFGQGGGEQIAGQALKSASYLAPAAAVSGLPSVGIAGSGIASGIGGGIAQGAKLGALGGGLGGAGNAMSQGASSGDVIGQGLQGATIGGIAGGVIGGVTGGLSKPNPNELNTSHPIFSSNYDQTLANAQGANMQAGNTATDAVHEASNTINDMTVGAGNQYAQAPQMISQVDPNAGTTLNADILAKMNELKDTKAWSLPDSIRNADSINGEIKLTPQDSQDLIKSLNDLKYNSKGDVRVNSQVSSLVSDVKNAAQAGMGHVTDNLGNSVWDRMSQDYQQVQDAKDAMSSLIPIKKFQGEILDPKEVNDSVNKMMKMMETPQGTSALLRSNAEVKAATGYDILNDPMDAIQKLMKSNEEVATATKGNYGHQFLQGLKNPQTLSRRAIYTIGTILGIATLGTAFRKQIGSLISGQ
jgi:hypothetical protein